MTKETSKAMDKVALAMIRLPKDHPMYREQEELHNLLLAAFICGTLFGLILGIVFTLVVF